jgi:hypothetical protein
VLKAAHIRVHLLEPQLDDAIRHGHEDDIGVFNMTARQRTEVRAERHPDANTYQAALAFAICADAFQSFPLDHFVGAAFQHPPMPFANPACRQR